MEWLSFFKGLFLGVLISIPVGPIAVLCVQRTLDRGRRHGFATGLGAATSDLFYSVLAVFSLGFVRQIIDENHLVIGIIGEIVVVCFGIYLYRSNPSAALRARKSKRGSYLQDYVSALGLTISNPLFLLFLIPVFAQFNFVNSESSLFEIFLGLLGVLSGAVLWWFGLSAVVSVFHNKINVRGLGLLNKISAFLLFALALGGFIYYTFVKFHA